MMLVWLAVAAAGNAFASIPQPVTGHPRLWITAADVPRLQGWATSANPIYEQGLLPVLAQATTDYNTCFPGGVPASPYPDVGDTQGYTGIVSEQDALVFALFSLIDPDPAARIQDAQHARNLIMIPMNQAALGPLANAPFRDPLFPVYNRANFTSEAWPLVVDWIYNAVDANNQPILTAQDKATIRAVFLIWANECLNASTTGGDHPAPVGTTNSLALLPGGNAYRMASNNYYLGHARLLSLMSLAFDPADDPAIDPNTPADTLGNSIRSYISDATGAWLYQQYAMLGEPSDIISAYGLATTASVGLASGGLPPEGMLYGHSYAFILGELLALKTAGFADPSLSGPQAALASSSAPVWDRFTTGFISSLVPAAQTPTPAFTDPLTQISSTESYLGAVYESASYGDTLRNYMTPDFVAPFALLALLDQKNGVASRLNAERWFAVNAVQGGAAALISRVSDPWSYGVQDALFAFLLLDPGAAAATDPRPAYPTAFYDAPQGRLVEHAGWSPGGAMFDFRCSWNSINHQQDDANQFELYRKGEWLTKGLANYDDNSIGQSTDFHNTLSLQNWCASNISNSDPNGIPNGLQFYETPLWTIGSQWPLALSAGDPAAVTSVGSAYTYAYGDTTNLYNLPDFYTPANAAADIVHASRSILWLKPDHIVVYDRATSQHAGLFKHFSLTVVGTPVIAGNLVTTNTPGGQHLYITSLLPASATAAITASPVASAGISLIADLEPATDRVIVEDTSKPADVRFLHVLQGADAGASAEPATLVQSTSGTPFDGAVVAGLNTVVMFKRDMSTPFATVTFGIPPGTASYYVTGLTPNAGYAVSESGATVTVTPGGTSVSDQAGVLSGPPSPGIGPVAPSITSQPAAQAVALAANASFSIQAAGTPPLTYQWQHLPSGGAWMNLSDGSVYGGSSTSTLTVTGATAAMSGDQYQCVVTGVSPSATSNAASLTVLAPASAAPSIQTQPALQAVAPGANATYSVAATGQGELSYQWQESDDGGKTWTPLLYSGSYWDGGSSQVLTIDSVTAAMNGDLFECVVNNGTGPDATSAPVALIVLTTVLQAPAISSQPVSETVAAGSSATFSVAAAGAAPLSYQWQLNGSNLTDGGGIAGSTGPEILIANVGAGSAGSYVCVVTNGGGSAPSNAATLALAGSSSNPGVASSLSARAFVGTGDTILIGGFYIVGSTSRTVLVQALGPALANLGVSGALQHPALSIHQSRNGHDTTLFANAGWGSSQLLLDAAASVFASPVLTPGSADAELLLTLPPGGYSAEVSGADGGTGVALCAMYELP